MYLYLLHRLFSHQDDADIDDPLPESSSGQTLGEGMAVEGGVAVDGGEAVEGGQVEQATPKSIKCEEYVLLMLIFLKEYFHCLLYTLMQLREVVQE